LSIRKAGFALPVLVAAIIGWLGIHLPPAVHAQSKADIYLGSPKRLDASFQGPDAIVRPLNSGQATPLSLASGDFDADGIADLATGYATADGGRVAIMRGNLDAFAPQTQESHLAIGQGNFPPPYLALAQVVAIAEQPDSLAAGVFIGHNGPGLVAAARGGHTVYVLAPDDSGNFQVQQTLDAPGSITALAAYQLDTGQYAQVVAGVHGESGPALLVYTGSNEGLSAASSFPLTADATGFAFGNLDGDAKPDVLVITGGQLSILHGGRLGLEPVSVPFTVAAAALGNFVPDRDPLLQMALLSADGNVHILAQDSIDSRPFALEEMQARKRAQIAQRGRASSLPPSVERRVVWKEVENFPAAGGFDVGGMAPQLFRTRITGNGSDDVMILGAGRLSVIAHPGQNPTTGVVFSRAEQVNSVSAALPLRVNVDGRLGVVLVRQDGAAPFVMMPLPDPTFFPNRFDDIAPRGTGVTCLNTTMVDGSNDCTLREAIIKANGDTIMLQAGTYQLSLPKVANDYTGNHGALYMNHSATIVGMVDGMGHPTSIIQAGTNATNGVDLVLAVNADSIAFTSATGSLSNLVIKFGHNNGTFSGNQDGFGGGIEFDTGLAPATATLTLTNCTVTNNVTTDGDGGGLALFNTNSGTGFATITNSIIQNNSPVESSTGGSGLGGGIFVGFPAKVVLNNTQVINNTATEAIGVNGQGGGIFIFGGSGSPTSAIHGSTISGNQSAGNGGGIYSTTGLTIDTGTIISNNTSGLDGGGLWYNNIGATASLSKVTITGNNAGAHKGGGIRVDSGAADVFNLSFSRIAGNTATLGGSNLSNLNGTVTAQNNWWGTNAAATTIDAAGGTTTFDPFIVLTHTASPNKIRINQTAALTADMSKDNHGSSAALSGNLDRIIGLPIAFNNAVDGSITSPQATIQNNGMATATFNAGSVAGGGKADAVVDQATVTANIIVLQPPSIAKSFNPTKIVLNTGVSTLTFSVTNPNVVTIDSSFTDTFTSGMQVAATPNASNTCGGTWAPVAGATSVTFANPALPVGACTITVDVKGTIETTVNNSVTINSSDAGNGNTSSANLIVYVPPVLAIAKNHSGTFTQGQTATWTLQVTNNSSSATGTTDGTTVTVNDTLPAGYTLQSGTGTNWSCLGNGTNVATCTSSDVIAGNGGTFNLITLTVNVPANSPTSVQNTGKVFGGGDVIHTNSGNAATGSDTVTVIQVPASITINGSATQSTRINTAFGSLAVTVKDAGNVTIPNYSSVVFTAPASGQSGTFDNATNTKTLPTNGSGIADPGTFTANGVPGAYTVDVAAGPAPHATFNLTNQAPDLTISKAHVGNGFTQGQQGAQYTLTVTNGGGVASSGTITVTDTLPSGLTFASGTGTGWSCSANGQAVTCTDAATPIPASGTSTITLNVNVSNTAPGTVSNTAAVACTCTESNTNNNTSNTDMVTISQLPDLTISKAHVGTSFTPGQQGAQYTLTVTNGGAGASSGTITVTDTLPSGLTFASGTGTGWLCSANGQLVTCTDAATPIAASGISTITLNVNVAANAPSSLMNSAAVACTCTETNTNNNTSNTDTVSVTQPDLTISKAHVGTSFAQGQQGAQYTLTVTNGGAGASSGTITVTDTLPSGLTFASGTGAGWSCMANGQAVTCTDAATPIAASGTSTITLNVNVAANAPASAMNSATVACTCTESNTNNNTSNTDTVTINTNAAADVTGQVTITRGVPVFNRLTSVWSQTVSVKNNGPGALSNAAYVLDSLNAGWTVTNADGTTAATTPAGSPYKVLGPMAPNATVTVTLLFTRTGTPALTYTVRVLDGTPR
jgi:uncharacterized repeat protein (TIGR01451 family)